MFLEGQLDISEINGTADKKGGDSDNESDNDSDNDSGSDEEAEEVRPFF